MSTASVLSLHPGPYTLSDLEAMPEDGQRYELIDGCLFDTPAPTPLHQRVARRLSGLLTSAGRPEGLETIDSIDIDCGRGTVLQPDAVVLPAVSVDAGPSAAVTVGPGPAGRTRSWISTGRAAGPGRHS